jgi:Chromo (CHRromatin Organisation MOdifier) domain
MPRRCTRRAVIDFTKAQPSDDENSKDSSSVEEVLLLDSESDYENVGTRQSARLSKRREVPQSDRRTSACIHKSHVNVKDESESEEEGDVDSTESNSKNCSVREPETTVHVSKNRLMSGSCEPQSSDCSDGEKASRRGAQKSKAKCKGDPPRKQEFALFIVSTILAARTEQRSMWAEVCKTMNTTEIENGSRLGHHLKVQDDDMALEECFLIKWNDLSFVHCSWETQQGLESLVEGSRNALSTFIRRREDDGLIYSADERCDGEFFDPAWTQVERILELHIPDGYPCDLGSEDEAQPKNFGVVLNKASDEYEAGRGRQFLVKWNNLPYSESTYEYERDLLLCDIQYADRVEEFRVRTLKVCLKKTVEAFYVSRTVRKTHSRSHLIVAFLG